MAFIRTILGDIAPGQLGVCDSHEHLIRSYGAEIQRDADFLMDSVELATQEYLDWAAAGGNSMICMDPLGCGRNVDKMATIAKAVQDKGHIVMATGFHMAANYDLRGHWLMQIDSMDKIVSLLSEEINIGMDRYGYLAPMIERTEHRAGVIKAGTSYTMIADFEYRALQAAALTQQATGAPISVHTQNGTMGYEVANYLKSNGADADHVVICHLQKNPDRYYYQKVLDTGAILCFDGPDRVKYAPDIVLAENIKWLIDHGYQSQILLSMDAGKASYQRHYMRAKGKDNLGISYLLTRFVPLLRQIGISNDAVDAMLVHNPARVFSFIEK